MSKFLFFACIGIIGLSVSLPSFLCTACSHHDRGSTEGCMCSVVCGVEIPYMCSL
jgi:hypothetical protein